MPVHNYNMMHDVLYSYTITSLADVPLPLSSFKLVKQPKTNYNKLT